MKIETCPYCGNLLEEGEIKNRGFGYYLPKDSSPPRWYSKRAMDKKGAIMLPPDPISVPPVFPKALVCRNCKMILIPYDEEEENL